MAILTLEYGKKHVNVAKQIVSDKVIDRLLEVQLVDNNLVFKCQSKKKLDGLNDDITQLCNLLEYTENNFIVYEDTKFGHLCYKKYDHSTNQIITRFNNTTLSIVMFKDGSFKIF